MVAAALAATGTALTLAPLAGMVRIAQIALGGASSDIWTLVIASVVSLFAGMALILAGELAAHLADNRLTHHLRLAAARRLSQVPLGWFTQRASGEVKQVLQDDIATLHSLTAHFYTAVGRAAGAIVASAAYLFAMDWRLAIVALLPFPGFFLFLRRAMKASGAHMQEFVERLGRINSATVEFVNGIPVVKAFGDSGRAHGGYREAVDGFARAFAAFARPLVGTMAHAHAMIAPVTVLGLVLAFGLLYAHLGWMAPLDVLPFALVAPGICAPMLLLHTLLHDLGGAAGAAQRVQALLQTPTLDVPAPGQQQQPDGQEIRFEDVSYAYGPEHQALSNLNFTLAPGTVTAVVGPSGAGKSTLARLLLRFFDPTSGRITLGGADLRQLDSTALYRHIGFVLQDVRLIHASVRDNIALGRPSASQAEIEDAARTANIHERILALPRGYDSVIGEDALLSGGERQRVSIARAVLLDPPVLVLDEATAAADAGNEVAIQDALSRFAQGRTLLVIAHRLDTVMHADRILVLDGGVIAEHGTHAQLLARQGRYARLWAMGGYEAPAHLPEFPC
jgi:ATP-binding cassette subfamily B protein